EGKLVQWLWKTVWRFLKKLKIELPYDPAMAPLGIYSLSPFETTTHAPQNPVLSFQLGTCTTMFTAALSTIAKSWKEPKCPSTDEWIK
ncbi:LORF2 protein, partial [Crocuta crocuta]